MLVYEVEGIRNHITLHPHFDNSAPSFDGYKHSTTLKSPYHCKVSNGNPTTSAQSVPTAQFVSFFEMAIFCGNLYDMDCCDILANNYLSDRQSIENYGGTTSPSRWKGKQNEVFYVRWRSNWKLLNEVPEAVSPNKIMLRSKLCRSFPGSGLSYWMRHCHLLKKSVEANHKIHFPEEKNMENNLWMIVE